MFTPFAALSISSEVEKFGAYAGFAAVLGLAVLSLLYFASAREIKRLREWADRAPERVADLEARVGDLARQRAAMPQPVGKAAPAKPGAKPATVAANATAAAKPGAKAAATNGDAKDAAKKPAAAETPAEDGAPAVIDDVDEAAGDLTEIKKPTAKVPAKDETLISPGAGRALRQNKPSARPRTPPPVRPSTARLMESARATNAQRMTGGPPAAGASKPPGEGNGRKRIAIIVGTILAGIVVAVILVTQVFSGGGGGSNTPQTNVVVAPTNTGTTADSTSVDRADTTVAVFNGTSFSGLAKGVADEITNGGFKRGDVRNALDQTRSATIVEYSTGNKAAALEVAKTIDVGADAVAPVDAGTQSLAPTAQVIVTVGSDQTPTTTG
jgi:hypothetical protein